MQSYVRAVKTYWTAEEGRTRRQGIMLSSFESVMWIRIRIHLGPWIRIQGCKMKGKAEFSQQICWGFF